MKALLVDDEMPARQYLKDLLKAIPSIEVVGEAKSIDAAAAAVSTLDPDIIFLDIQFPNETGFDLFEKIEVKARVVFVTAFDEYALRAFEVNAVDYLLKPVNPERLRQTLDRITSPGQISSNRLRPLNYGDMLYLLVNTHYHFFKVSSIVKIGAAGGYTEAVFSNGKKGLVHKPIKEWEERLPADRFARIHRSTIVNLEFVDRIERWDAKSSRVYLKGESVPETMSRNYQVKIKTRMG